MNRQLSREQERKKKKLQTWLKSFNADQKMLWEQTILSEIQKNDEITALIMDKCYMSAVANNIDVDILDLEKIIKECNTYMQDYKNKLEKGDVVTMVKSLETKIQSKMRSLIKGGKGKVESIKELEKEYKIPFAELDVMWLQVKSKMGIVNKNSPKPKNIIEEEVKEIIEGTKAENELDTRIRENAIPYTITEKDSETVRIEESRNTQVKESAFKIKSIILEGKHGTYSKDSEGVKTEKIFVKDIEDLGQYKQIVQAEYDKGKEELKQKLKEVQEDIRKLDERVNKNFEIIEEIKEIFNM